MPVDDAELAALRQANVALQRQLDEATAQRAASAEVMQLIGVAPGDAEATLQGIADITQRLFGASSVTLLLADGPHWGTALRAGAGSERIASTVPQAHLGAITPQYLPGAVYLENRQIHLPDLDDPATIARWPGVTPARAAGVRATVGTPLRREGRAIGSLVVHRNLARPFSDAELALLQGFADQAAIATGNARLIVETREALDRQTATADILKVIARSSTDVQPVLDAIATAANRLAGGFVTTVLRIADGMAHLAAFTGTTPETDAALRSFYPQPLTTFSWSPAILRGEIYLVEDTERELAHDPASLAIIRKRGWRSACYVPLLRDGKPIGAIGVTRAEPGLFAGREVELLKTFADQAVIAMENAGLLRDLSESLRQQTATAEVLKVISRSVFDLQQVLDTLVESAYRICGAQLGLLYLRSGEAFECKSVVGAGLAVVGPLFKGRPIRAGRGTAAERVILTGEVHWITDFFEDPEFDPAARAGLLDAVAERSAAGELRSSLAVPMMRDGSVVGVLVIARAQTGTFPSQQVELLQTFADQAVIAIENTRLFNETKEALERQTASADILKVIASSPADVQPVFDAVVLTAHRLFGREFAAVLLCAEDGTTFWPRAVSGRGELIPILNPAPTKVDPEANFPSRAIVSRQNLQVPDWSAIELPAEEQDIRAMYGINSALYLPMLRGADCIGVLLLGGSQPGMFNEADIALAESFRDQALIAIENTRLFNETREALEQQKASADVLGVISKSVAAAQPVFDEILASIERLFSSEDHAIYLARDDMLHIAAIRGPRAERARALFPVPIEETASGIAFRERRLVRSANVLEDPALPRALRERYRNIGTNYSMAVAPLLSHDGAIGSIMVTRTSMVPFTDKECALLRTFADQAVIAIENARLFDEVQAKTRELTARNSAYSEQIDHQSATIEILKAMSASPGDAQPVFDIIVQRAMQICNADIAVVLELQDSLAHLRSIAIDERSTAPEVVEAYRKIFPQPPSRASVALRAILQGEIVHIPSMAEDLELSQASRDIGRKGALAIPLLRDGNVIGSIGLSAKVVGGFSDAQIELLKTFAEQAVIAIRSAETFRQLHTRTSELSESLQQQTATADVLKVISRSAFDLEAVFETVVERSARLTGAEAARANIFRYDGELLRISATYNVPPHVREWLEQNPIRPGRHSGSARAALERRTIHVPDVLADPDYTFGARAVEPYRTILGVPIIKANELLGVLLIYLLEVKPFDGKQIALVETFADQAAIAIENTRLFNETKEALERQTATADVLKVISRSAFDLQNVFDTLLDSAARLVGASNGALCVRDGDVYPYRATIRRDPAWAAYLQSHPARGGRHSISGRVILSGEVETIADVRRDPEYDQSYWLEGHTSMIGVPLLRSGQVEGVFSLARTVTGGFTQGEVDLVRTFADQASIAIENTRLFDEVQARTRELTQSLDDLRAAQDRLVQTEKLASLGQLTAGIAHEIKNPLNFVNNFAALSADLTDELREVLDKAAVAEALRAEIDEIAALLKSNLEKVVQHGKRADSIVRNMLLHSREGSGEHRPTDVNALVEESLNLAYHGARAETPQFNVTLARDLDPAAGTIEAFPQEITRVLLNLIGNGFYAMARRGDANGAGYAAVLNAATRDCGDHVEIRIRDNGTGIPAEVKEKMFNPFFTTKPAGEGTGLGLSMSHDIVVKQHGGSIDVDTAPGAFTEFVIRLPRQSRFGNSG